MDGVPRPPGLKLACRLFSKRPSGFCVVEPYFCLLLFFNTKPKSGRRSRHPFLCHLLSPPSLHHRRLKRFHLSSMSRKKSEAWVPLFPGSAASWFLLCMSGLPYARLLGKCRFLPCCCLPSDVAGLFAFSRVIATVLVLFCSGCAFFHLLV